VLDLASGELVETGSYYANGARETYRASSHGDRVAAEPMGFTGKEADEEVGLTYFGQRYLMSHLGRWASPDPLQTHAVGGGEAINGYHYVAGNVLQARDPVGLVMVVASHDHPYGQALDTSRRSDGRPNDSTDMAEGHDLERRFRDGVLAEASTVASALRGRGDLVGADAAMLRGAAEAAAISLNEATGVIEVRDIGTPPEARGNLYGRYLAAASDTTNRYLVGYGDGNGELGGMPAASQIPSRRARSDGGFDIDIVIDRVRILTHRGAEGSGPGGVGRRSAADDYEGGGDAGFDRAITEALTHEVAIHAGRWSLGFGRSSLHGRNTFHANWGTAADTPADVESHYVAMLFNPSADHRMLHHTSPRGGGGEVPRIDVATYRFATTPGRER